MREYNEMIDRFHGKDFQEAGLSPRDAEWGEMYFLPKFIKIISDFPEKDEPKKGLKLVCHHYTLDSIQSQGYGPLLEIAKESGLTNLYKRIQENERSLKRAVIDELKEKKTPASSDEMKMVEDYAETKFNEAKEVLEQWHKVQQSTEKDEIKNQMWSFENTIK